MEGVHPDAKYRLVAVSRLVGIQLVVMVHSKHYQYVRNIDIDTVGTGILGKMVRKEVAGSTAYLTDFCFRAIKEAQRYDSSCTIHPYVS